MSPHEQLTDIVKVAPPLTVTGMTILGYPMSDWVLALTAVYTLLQIIILVRRSIVSKRTGDRPGVCSVNDCPARKQQ